MATVADLTERERKAAVERARKMSRLQLTQELIESIVAMVEEGHWPETAARSLGVLPSTYRGWLEKGEAFLETGESSTADVDGLQAQLYVRVNHAEGGAEIDLGQKALERIEKGQDWRGQMHWMERRWPDRWGKREPQVDNARRVEDEIKAFLRGADAGRQLVVPE